MKERLLHAINGSIEAVTQLKVPKNLLFMEGVSRVMAASLKGGNKVLVAGNGGSLCDAAHFAEELTGFFRKKRPALPAIALADPGHMSCVANDLGFDWVFSRALEALGKEGDLFVGLTTSGNSPNIVNAFEVAKQKGLHTVAFLGKDGGKLKGFADWELIIEGFETSDRIQEAHMAAIHMMIEMVEAELFETSALKWN